MNAQRTKQLMKLQALTQEIENTLENMFEDIDWSVDNMSDNDMEHLPVFDRLSEDLSNVEDAQESVADLFQALEACING